MPSIKRGDFAELVTICLVLLGVLYSLNSSWLFISAPDGIDPYIYLGYVINGPRQVHAFKDLYYSTRIPAIAPGWFVHSVIADPLPATVVLRFFYGLVLALGAAAAAGVFVPGKAAPRTTIVLALVNPYVLWAIGWDYVDGATLAYLLAALGAVSVAAARRSYMIAAMAGAFYALAVSAHLLVATLAPALLLIGIAAGSPISLRSLLRLGLAAIIGFSVGVALTSIVSMMMGGRFLYFVPLIDTAFAVYADRGIWKAATYDWVARASWLLFPGAATLCAGLFALHALIRRAAGKGAPIRDARLLWLCLAQLAAALTFLALEWSGSSPLQQNFAAVYLNSISIVLLVSLWFHGADEEGTASSARAWTPVLVLAGVVLTLWEILNQVTQAGGTCSPSSCLGFGTMAGGFQAALVLALVVAATAILRPAMKGPTWLKWRIAGCALVLGCLSIVFAVSFPPGIFQWSSKGAAQRQYLDLIRAVRVIRDANPNLDLRFWYNHSDPEVGVFGRALASAHLYGYRLISGSFPSPHHPFFGKPVIEPGMRIIVLSSAPDAVPLAKEAIASFDLTAQVEQRIDLSWRGDIFSFSVLRVMSR
jgi:hypothetical protein